MKRRRNGAEMRGTSSQLRLDDLRGRVTIAAKLMNVQVSEEAMRSIDRIAAETGSTKTDTVSALLNEGLAVWAEISRGWQPPEPDQKRKRRGRPMSRPAAGGTQ